MPGEPVILIAIGGILGANARYLVSLWAARRIGTGFPYGTLIANASGSLLLGFLVAGVIPRITYGSEFQLLLATGFCGAYTTFSTFAYESIGLLRQRAYRLTATYVLASAITGLVGAWLGAVAGQSL